MTPFLQNTKHFAKFCNQTPLPPHGKRQIEFPLGKLLGTPSKK